MDQLSWSTAANDAQAELIEVEEEVTQYKKQLEQELSDETADNLYKSPDYNPDTHDGKQPKL